MTGASPLGRKQLPITSSGRLGPELECVHAKKFGKVYAPESLSDLVYLLEQYAEAGPKIEAWRGQADIRWGIECTATRRVRDFLPEENTEPEKLETTILEYEERLLNEARMVGHGFWEGRELSDLELLSLMRHYGAATRLMDFTRNAFVALWFATQANEDGYGLLIGARPRPHNVSLVRTEQHLKKCLKQLLEDKGLKNKCIYWEPRHLFERMRVQQSLFLFGRVVSKAWGTAPFGRSPSDFERPPDELILIAVSPQLKRRLTDIDDRWANWESLYGYNHQYLFPDLPGYAEAHAAGSGLRSSFYKNEGRAVGQPDNLNADQ